MSIAMCCVMNYSCTSDFEDEAVQPAVKRAVVQAWSPEVLQRARELGIIIVDEDRQWNNLKDDDVVFYLNLLTEKGDSAFSSSVAPQLHATSMLRRMSSNVKEETGSTVHDHTWFEKTKQSDSFADYTIGISITWGIEDGKVVNPLGGYTLVCTGKNGWKAEYSSLSLSMTPREKSVDYSLDGTITLGKTIKNTFNEPEKKEFHTIWIHLKGTAL